MIINEPLLRLPTKDDQKNIPINEIIRIEALSNYSKIHLLNGKTIVLAKVLRWFEEVLPQDKFVRIHRSHLVNIQYISVYTMNQKHTVILKNNTHIEVARRKKISIKKICAVNFLWRA